MNVKKNINIDLTCLFWLWWIWRLPLEQLLFSLRTITVNPWFFHQLLYWRWSWVLLWHCFSSVYTEMWCTFCSLLTNFAEMHFVFKSSDKIHWIVPYYCPTISQTSWIQRRRNDHVKHAAACSAGETAGRWSWKYKIWRSLNTYNFFKY